MKQIYTFARDCKQIATQLIHNALLSELLRLQKEFSALMVNSSKNRNTLSKCAFSRFIIFSIGQSFRTFTHQFTAHGFNLKTL
jgi:hypothetical protein